MADVTPLAPWVRRCLQAAAALGGVALAWLTVVVLGPPLALAPSDQEPALRVPELRCDEWYALPVQDGRVKPLQSFAVETMRHVTGRSAFQRLDPVAVVLSWVLQEGDDWEQQRFVLCDHRGLRRQIFEGPGATLSAVQEAGRHVAPADLRRSPGFDRLLETAARKRRELQGRAHLELSDEHLKAEEVARRLISFDTLCGRSVTRLHLNALAGDAYLDVRDYADIEDSTPEQALAKLARQPQRRLGDLRVVPLLPGGDWLSFAQLRAMRQYPALWQAHLAHAVRQAPELYLPPSAQQAFERCGSGRAAELRRDFETALAERGDALLHAFEEAQAAGDRQRTGMLLLELSPVSLERSAGAALVDELRRARRQAEAALAARFENALRRVAALPADAPDRRQLQLEYVEALFPDLYKEAVARPFPAGQVDALLAALQEARSSYRAEQRDGFSTASRRLFGLLQATADQAGAPYPDSTTLGLELQFNRWQPFRWAWITMLVAVCVLGAGLVHGGRWPYRVGLTVYAASLLVQFAGFALRLAISGRAPVSNMYETVIFVGLMSACLALLLEGIYRRGVIIVAGAAVSTLALVLADQLPLALDPRISPVVPVLRTNYWLTVHVLTVVCSYAAGTLAWGLGNLTLGLVAFGRADASTLKALARYTYRALQVAVLLLAAGTLLGGWWAAESWGRFWGWDPKEVGALIALICYVVPLHARYLGWVQDYGLAVAAVLCYASILLSWYVVNFVVASGLHSYGFGAGGALWFLWASVLNLEWVLIATLVYERRPRGVT